jgi:16S rRNA (adenine1518-N6/adenine1519-N6)-dimethyltransferase
MGKVEGTATPRPKKRFGQHFLHDPGILQRIVQCIAPRPGERLVEIGPGEGALTLPLLAAAGTLTAIELDADLIAPLQKKASGIGVLEVIHADVLRVDLSALAGAEPFRLVGNLPYNVSTPILFHCLRHAAVIRDMHFMLQREVVERMAARPGGKEYGRLSVMLQLRCIVQPLLRVPAGAFRPPPKVESAVVRLLPRAPRELPAVDPGKLDRIVRAAFGQRRKTLANALAGVLDVAAITAAGVDPRARAEQIPPPAFVSLAQHLDRATD